VIINIIVLLLSLSIILFWGIPSIVSLFYGAPWVPTPKKVAERMIKLAKLKKGDVVYDLGSGYGRILIYAAKRCDIQAVGIEIDPIKCLISRLLVWICQQHKKVRIINGNFFKKDLSNSDVVFCYLLQQTNIKLMDKLKRELKPGARIVSHSFTFPSWKVIKKDKNKFIYLYIAGESY